MDHLTIRYAQKSDIPQILYFVKELAIYENIQAQEEDWNILSLYVIENESGCSGEEVIQDDAQDVEAEAIMHLGNSALHAALSQLDAESYRL